MKWITNIMDKVGEKLKPMLCHNNWFSDFWYDKVYGYMDCICCVFWRGVFIGVAFSVVMNFLFG